MIPKETLAERANNPGNITGEANWLGKTGTENGRFVKFETPELGFRAMAINLRSAQDKHGRDTVQKIIGAYAPPGDNNPTHAYISRVAKEMGVASNEKIDLHNDEQLEKMMWAMTGVEAGKDNKFTKEQLKAGIAQANGLQLAAVTPSSDATEEEKAKARQAQKQIAEDNAKGDEMMRLLSENPVMGILMMVMMMFDPNFNPFTGEHETEQQRQQYANQGISSGTTDQAKLQAAIDNSGRSAEYVARHAGEQVNHISPVAVTARVTSEFDNDRAHPVLGTHRAHKGADIASMTPGAKPQIVATADGFITFAGQMKGYGNLVEIQHANGEKTRYGHLSRIDAEIGQEVKQGAGIGYMGDSGLAKGVHLHYEQIAPDGKQHEPTLMMAGNKVELDEGVKIAPSSGVMLAAKGAAPKTPVSHSHAENAPTKPLVISALLNHSPAIN